ncbi:MAG: FMN-binding glutamate synthase family protein, partial [Dehalococcoidia bacterium]|nr:FMN-binding glutamate synthase family protein [Dehalococcoidia bacterium]
MPALGDYRWTADLILSTRVQAETGRPPSNGLEYRVGNSGGGFDVLDFKFLPEDQWLAEDEPIDTSIPLNRRHYDPKIRISVPFYGGGMSFGSISEQVMLARAKAVKEWDTFVSTGEGGYPEALIPYKDHVITQIATGMFGVSEQSIKYARI